MKRLINLLASGAALSLSSLSGLNHSPERVGRSSPRKPQVHVKPEPYKAVVHYKHPDERQRIINKMTNWQRSQAGRACKGNWRSLTNDQLQKFADLPHWKTARKAALS